MSHFLGDIWNVMVCNPLSLHPIAQDMISPLRTGRGSTVVGDPSTPRVGPSTGASYFKGVEY